MKIPPLLCMAALCHLPLSAAPDAAPKPLTPLGEAKNVTVGIKKAMESMLTAIEKAKDEKTAQDAADAIFDTTETLVEFAKKGRELKDKLNENEKKELEKSMEELNMAGFNERFGKAFMGLAEKPELIEIIKPAIASFTAAAMQMAAEEAGNGGAVPGRDRGAPIRIRDKGAQMPKAEPKPNVE